MFDFLVFGGLYVEADFSGHNSIMASVPNAAETKQDWSAEAYAIAALAKVVSGNKLEELVVRLQRHTGRTKDQCWRFIIQRGLKRKTDHRRWSESEIDDAREGLVNKSLDEVAAKLHRSPQAVRSMLQRYQLSLREIRCDRFSLESLSTALRVRKSEIQFWISQGWLQATVETHGRKRFYTITPESLAQLYKKRLPDLLARGAPNLSLFEAYVQYCYSPKHTVGSQLLDVRRDKKERAAYAALGEDGEVDSEEEEDEDEEDEDRYFLDAQANGGFAGDGDLPT